MFQPVRQPDWVVTDVGTGLNCDGVLTGGECGLLGSVTVVVEVSLAVNEGSK